MITRYHNIVVDHHRRLTEQYLHFMAMKKKVAKKAVKKAVKKVAKKAVKKVAKKAVKKVAKKKVAAKKKK